VSVSPTKLDAGSGAATLTGILKGNGTSAFTAVTAPSGAIVGDSDTQTLTNKTLSGATILTSTIGSTNTIVAKDSTFTVVDDGDVTKKVAFQVSGLTTNTTRTLTAQDVSLTIAGLAETSTFTNKTISGSSNTLTVRLDAADVQSVLTTNKGGLGTPLTDPNADRIIFWDDSAGAHAYLATGTSLNITTTTAALSGPYERKNFNLVAFDGATTVTTGSSKAIMRIPADFNNWILGTVNAACVINGTTNALNVQLRRVRAGASVNLLSTRITIDSAEFDSNTAATPSVIIGTLTQLLEGDILAVDVVSVSTTAQTGLVVGGYLTSN